MRLAVPFTLLLVMLLAAAGVGHAEGKRFAYLTPGLDLPFWRYLYKGLQDAADRVGATVTAYDSRNDAATQLRNAQDAIARRVDGIFISPTDSSTAPSVLEAAKRAGIPVVIADIGTESGEYVSFIISDNEQGAYGVGQLLAQKMKERGWQNGTVGVVSISLARLNGQARTRGFRRAMEEAGIRIVQIQQMQTYTADETFRFVQDMLTAHPNMRGLFIQTDAPTVGAVRAVEVTRRQDQVLIAGFDGIPAFVDLIRSRKLVGSGMQQPWLMGYRSFEAMWRYLQGEKVEKEILVPILVVSEDNLEEVLPTIRQTVFANELQ